MSTHDRPAKRARQACVPCRRKKSRCPGEKPVCSHCARLGQQCTYSDDDPNSRQSTSEPTGLETPSRSSRPLSSVRYVPEDSHNTQRLNELEAKISEVLVTLQQNGSSHSQSLQSRSTTVQSSTVTDSLAIGGASLLVPQSTRSQVADIYLKYCHCQPLPLFSPQEFSTRFTARDEEVIFAVTAIALRFPPEPLLRQVNGDPKAYFEKAKSACLQRIGQGIVELSTLQALCLVSWFDFYDGNTHRASTYASLALDMCKSADLISNAGPDTFIREEKLRCFWTIVLLQRLHPNVSGPMYLSFDEDSIPPYPTSPSRPALAGDSFAAIYENRLPSYQDLGIVGYAIQLTEMWYRVIRYAHKRASAGPYPPWSPKSDYAKIIADQMHLETAMPYGKHRFKPAKFEERHTEELDSHRDYWSPWLFTQIIYHTIVCVLNHPLLLSLRLRNFRVASVPEIWLQHTDDLIAQHSQWIIHLIDIVDARSFLVTDPFLAHCVAIVATIHLQQSFGGEPDIRDTKKANFTKCLRFCQRVGEKWLYIQQVADKLKEFERVVSDSYFNSAASGTGDQVFIDLSLFWEILESATISEKPDTNGIAFGRSLRAEGRPSNAAEAFNARLLPETSRVVTAGSPADGIVSQQTPSGQFDNTVARGQQIYPSNDDFSVLAQSYFAQGQDFVGNMGDWWMTGNPHAG